MSVDLPEETAGECSPRAFRTHTGSFTSYRILLFVSRMDGCRVRQERAAVKPAVLLKVERMLVIGSTIP